MSAQKLNAISNQMAQANQMFMDLKTTEANYQKIRELGIEFDANAFEKQMTDLQDKLDNVVTKQVQDAFNQMTSADMAGKLDTIEEINTFRI